MGNFFRDDRSSGGWRGKKDFGGDRDKPEMHQTVCSECGQECEVPFKPNGRKPVFCRACFKKDEFDEGGSDRRDFDRREYDKPRFEKPRFEKPRFEKPAYPAPKEQGSGDQYKAQFEMLNFKMDMILKTLHQMGESKAAHATPKAHEPKKEAEVSAVEAPKVKKAKKAKKA